MSFQVEYRTSDRMIVGIGTEADNTYPVGYQPAAGDQLATLPDAQLDVVFTLDTSYLCADGVTVGAVPC